MLLLQMHRMMMINSLFKMKLLLLPYEVEERVDLEQQQDKDKSINNKLNKKL